jgi:pantoate--beta-alanine ligase
MGALHEGHVALMAEARRHGTCVAVSIFVNPTQFGPSEDFNRYPRDLPADLARCEAAGVDWVFTPSVGEMYPPGERTRVSVSGLTAHLCGVSRPGHFDGVATIVTKLLAAAGPCVAVFGRKDYQQLKVIERLAADLLLPVRVVGHRIVRESDGLAMSSRNRYLNVEERSRALALPRALAAAAGAFAQGERATDVMVSAVTRTLERADLRIDYVTVADADSLEPLAGPLPERAVLAVAAFCGNTRLIDNLVFGEDEAPHVQRGA